MNQIINNMKLLPDDVIINHIVPYTYKVQSKSMLMDIRSFYIDFSLIADTYYMMYNNNILLYDLHDFLKETNMRTIRFSGSNAIKRNKKSPSYVTLTDYYQQIRNSKIMFGMLTPAERTRFINKYIIDEEI